MKWVANKFHMLKFSITNFCLFLLFVSMCLIVYEFRGGGKKNPLFQHVELMGFFFFFFPDFWIIGYDGDELLCNLFITGGRAPKKRR